MDKKISEDQSKMKNISKMINEFTGNLTNEIYDDFNDIKYTLVNLTIKIRYLKDFETVYNKSISDKIEILVKELEMLNSTYLRDDWRFDLIN